MRQFTTLDRLTPDHLKLGRISGLRSRSPVKIPPACSGYPPLQHHVMLLLKDFRRKHRSLSTDDRRLQRLQRCCHWLEQHIAKEQGEIAPHNRGCGSPRWLTATR
jgi:hypothetical protein